MFKIPNIKWDPHFFRENEKAFYLVQLFDYAMSFNSLIAVNSFHRTVPLFYRIKFYESIL